MSKNMAKNLSRQDWQSADNQPIYLQLAEHFRHLIDSRYKAGDTLPAEHALAEHYEVNRHTIRRAIDELVIQGYVVRHQGKKTEVLDKTPLQYSLNIGRFTTGIDRFNKRTSTKILLTQQLETLPEDLKRMCRLSANTEVKSLTLIKTLRYVDDEPITIIDHYLNNQYVPDIAGQYTRGSLHACIKSAYGYDLIRGHAEISARLAQAEECDYIDCLTTQPMLLVKSVNHIKGAPGKIVEMSVSSTRADRMNINVDYQNAH